MYKLFFIHVYFSKETPDDLTSSPKVGEGPQLIELSSAAMIILLLLEEKCQAGHRVVAKIQPTLVTQESVPRDACTNYHSYHGSKNKINPLLTHRPGPGSSSHTGLAQLWGT